MQPVLSIRGLSKSYKGGLQALKTVDLDIAKGEIFALLGPNGAGKTTLINAVCGIITPTTGEITAAGYDTRKDYRAARALIGLVPQEMHIDIFETVWAVVTYSRGLFGLPPNPAYIEQILKDLSLWEKKDEKLQALSGGMKRRVLIAQALVHKPPVVILDEPTAGVDVELRRTLWQFMSDLHRQGQTVVLTTHYLEEAQEMCSRIAILDRGEVKALESTRQLLRRHPFRFLRVKLAGNAALPEALRELVASESDGSIELKLETGKHPIGSVFDALRDAGVAIEDVQTRDPDLEDIFVELTR